MITVIIPTLWLVPKLAQNLKELNSCKHVGEIILIDNTENTKKIELSKLTHILEGKNSYVNPAWNKGVRLAKYDKLLIINDDTWFDWNLIEEIEKYIKVTVGMIGIGHHNYSLQKTTQIKLEEIDQRPDAFACAFFIHKNSWFPIPEGIKIWCGDDWLFLTNKGVGKQNYKLINFKVEGSIATTEKKLRNQNNKFLQIITNDQNWMRQNVYSGWGAYVCKHPDWSNVGIGISTFSGESTGDKRTLITEKCIRSVLKAVGKNCVKVIVNDGSTNKKHINVLNKYRKDFHIIDSPQNRGIAATKNEAIKYMYDQGCDYMFLVDDDIELLRGFAEHYINAINKTKIQHFCFSSAFWPTTKTEAKNGVDLTFSKMVAGVFLTLTREMVERLGYFKILPYKYGHEHTFYTKRAAKIGFSSEFVDVAGSEKYIKDLSSIGNERSCQADFYKPVESIEVEKNWNIGVDDKNIFIPYEQHTKDEPKIAIIIHAFHLEILNELFHHIKYIPYKFDLYLNFAEITEENSEIISEIKKELIANNPNISFHFTTSDNRGQDLGGFLVSANLIRQLGLKYDYICKIHTKPNDSAESVHGVDPFGTQIGWRREFLETLLGNESRVKEIVDIFETRSDIGYISSHKFYCNRFQPQDNKENYDFFVEKMGLNKEHCWPNNTHFVAGTMFWMRGDILDFIASKNIALEEFEVGAPAADGLRSHAFERIFDATVRHLGYKSMMIRESFKYE